MATLEELEDKFLNQEKERQLGRYWATDIYKMERNILLLPISLILLR